MNEQQKKILNFIRQKGNVSGKELKEQFKITRQALNKHLKKLIKSGKIQKIGNTKGTTYLFINDNIKLLNDKLKILIKYKKKHELRNLDEQEVFDIISLQLNLKKLLTPNVFSIFSYAFTELLNNAIEHSYSKYGIIDLKIDNYDLEFKIKDYGIGIFKSIQHKYHLKNEIEAVRELIKGKATTKPEQHSGEGIFFTSKIADYMCISSHKVKIIYDNKKDDIILEEIRKLKGTDVLFKISRYSKKEITKIFETYAPEEYDFRFNKTKVNVKLYLKEYMSRSEAKRLLSRLNQFKEIILDFKEVKYIGQGFADEIFRVFQNRFPDIKIKSINTNFVIDAMIKHVVDNKK